MWSALQAGMQLTHAVSWIVLRGAGQEPTYTSDVIEAAQAQVLREQDAALQQTMALHRFGNEHTGHISLQIS